MNTSVARYLLGVLALVVIVVALGGAAVALRRRYFGEFGGALARLSELLIGLALLIGVLEILGTLGLFRLIPITVACAVVGGSVWWASGGIQGGPRRAAQRPALGASGGLAIAAAFTAVVAAEWASPMLQAYDAGVHVLDSMWYHLPLAASFAVTGHITPLRPDLEFLTAFYPATAELVHALGIVLLARDTLTPALNLLMLGAVTLAAWCIGRAAVVAAVAVVMATPMLVFSQPGSADNDVFGLFFLLTAVALLLADEDRPAVTVLAAVAAGLALGVKLTLVSPVLALTVGVIAIAPRHRRARTALLWVAPLLAAGGYWYVRNLIAVGNPAPWTSFGLLPTPAPPLQANAGFALVHYLGNGRVWSDFWQPALAGGLGGWWYVILAGAIAGPVLCVVGSPERRLRMLGVVALASLGAYLVTPDSAAGAAGDPVGIAFNLRYATPGLTLGLALLPLAAPFAGPRRQLALTAALGAVLVATVAEPRLWPGHHLAGALGVGVAGLLVVLIVVLPRYRIARAVPTRAMLAASLVLLLTAGVAFGYPWQRHYLRGRYAFEPNVSHLASLWAFFRGVHHARVGLAGTYGEFFSYPLFGLDDSNRVENVGDRGPHGSFTAITNCRRWRATVNAGHFRYLVATPSRDPFRPNVLGPSPEAGWTASDPAARVVFEARALRQKIYVFELSGPLDPSTCN